MSNIFTPVLHPRIERRKHEPPVKVHDMMPRGSNPITRFNTWLAIKVTNAVGTMWCAYAFAALALVSLPAAVASRKPAILVQSASPPLLQSPLPPLLPGG